MTITELKPRIEEGKLARLLGRRNKQKFSNALTSRLESWKERIDDLINPQITYVKNKIQKIENGCVYLTEHLKFESARLSRSMKECNEIVCFIATLNSDIEEEINELMEDNHLSDAYILDSMGSVAVENIVAQFHKRMESAYLAKGKSVTLRFSPGYCDWVVNDQKNLFSLFEAEDFPVTLSDSCLMEPRKSVSGVFGEMPNGNGKPVESYNPCIECGKKDCIARRK